MKTQPIVSAQRVYSAELRPYPEGDEPFLGLFQDAKGKKEFRIIRRASQPNGPFQFVCHEGAKFPYYLNDPEGWAPLPAIPEGD